MNAPSTHFEEILPLTPLQRDYLSAVQRGKVGGRCETGSVRVGPLDLHVLGRAWEEVQRAVPLLRTSFAWEDGDDPVQRIQPDPGGALELEDWREDSLTRQRAKMEEWLEPDAESAFDPARAPLARIFAARVTGGVYLVWRHHRLVLDRPSANRVWAVLWEVYRALSAGDEIPSPAFAGMNSHLDWIAQRDSGSDIAFWVKSLLDAPQTTRVPSFDAEEETSSSHPVLERELALNPAMSADLGAKAKQNEVGIGIALAGAWAVVLARHSAANELVFGISVSGQSTAGHPSGVVAGPFANVVPARVRIDPDDRFAPLLKRLQAWRRAARSHEYLPLDTIRESAGLAGEEQLFESQVDTSPGVPSGLPLDGSGGPPPPVLRWERAPLIVPATLGIKRVPKVALTLVCDGNRMRRADADLLLREVRDILEVFSVDPNTPLRDLLEPDGAVGSKGCLLLRRSPSSGAPLFLVHAAGGAAAPFAMLAEQLAPHVPCYAFQPPELIAKARGGASRSIEGLAANYLASMQYFRQSPPFHFGGWSFGGVVAYELAVQLSRSTCPPDLVAMFDAPFPTLLPEVADLSPSDRLLLYATSIGLEVGPEIAERAREVPLSRIAMRLLDRAKEVGRVATDLTAQRFLKEAGLFLIHLQALRAYRPPRYEGRVVYFAPEDEFESVERQSTRAHWKEVCPGLEVVKVPGSHFTMLKLPHVDGLSRALVERLPHAYSSPEETLPPRGHSR